MVRRLASRSREDHVASRRDYQTIIDAVSLVVRATSGGEQRLVMRTHASQAEFGIAGFGGFLKPEQPLDARVVLQLGEITRTRTIRLKDEWNRFGVAAEGEPPNLCLSILWEGSVAMNVWGLDAGFLALPPVVRTARPTAADLEATHLTPETFYLPHDGPIALEIDPSESLLGETAPGVGISLKKCAYCGRYLPLDRERPGALSFHRHAAKLTGHQNECRSCKKWRINDTLNIVRIPDQHNESSLITRERKVFLREPQILQTIKQRTGAGLKSQVWERFGRKCFYCGKPLELDEVQLDHTRPLAYLWPIDEHATCLCAEHNNEKRERFPVDFYSEPQLRELAEIIGLPYEALSQRRLNQEELQRILDDLPTFAKEWEPRHFAATAYKIAEMQREIDLFALLAEQDPATHATLVLRLRERPAPAVPIEE